MVRKTKEDALATRNLILDTAERVFQRRGVSRTSLHEVAQAAGLTRGAIYWHFQNKADLFDAMVKRVTLPLETSIECRGAVALGDPLGTMRAGIAAAFEKTVHDPQVQRVLAIASHKTEYIDELQSVADRRLAYRGECLDDIERLFAAAIALGQVRADVEARSAAIGLHALVDGLLLNWLFDPTAFDLEIVGRTALDGYLAGFAPRPTAATRR